MGDMAFGWDTFTSAGSALVGATKAAVHALPIPTTKGQIIATVLAPEIALPYLVVKKTVAPILKSVAGSSSSGAAPAAPAEDPHRYDNIDMSGANRAATAAGNTNAQFHAWVAAGSPVAPSGAPILPGPSGTSIVPTSSGAPGSAGAAGDYTLPDGTPITTAPTGILAKLAALSTPMKLGLAVGAAGLIYLGVKHFGGGSTGHAPKSAEPLA